MKTYTIPYKPRPLQRQLHNEVKRFSVLVMHRRFGKTVFAINHALKKALTTPLKNPRVLFLAPYRTSAKSIAWDYLKEYSRAVPRAKFNEAELRADFPNGARIQLAGADNYEALRGNYYDLVIFDETAQINPKVWTSVIRPAVSDRQGDVIFLGTPSGEDNFFHDLYEHAQETDGWYANMYKASETNLIPEDELQDARRAMDQNMYLQEFECSFGASLVGAIYGDLITEAKDRIGSVPHDRNALVHTAWDLGMGDSTTIIFWQEVHREIRFINCIEDTGQGLDHYVRLLRDYQDTYSYNYGTHLFPHDLAVRELGTGVSREETMRNLGVTPKIMPRTGPNERIHAARSGFDRFWFDKEKFGDCLKALKQYRYEFDDKRKMFRSQPRHDWCSHYADAFGLACEGFRMTRARQKMKQQDRSWII